MLQYYPNRYIDNYFPKRYFQIKEGEVFVQLPKKEEISLGGYSPLLEIDREELFKEISVKLPHTKIIPLISNLLVKIENNSEEDELIVLTLINTLFQQQKEEDVIYYVQLITQLVEIIEKEEEIEKENDEIVNIIEELNKLNMF